MRGDTLLHQVGFVYSYTENTIINRKLHKNSTILQLTVCGPPKWVHVHANLGKRSWSYMRMHENRDFVLPTNSYTHVHSRI